MHCRVLPLVYLCCTLLILLRITQSTPYARQQTWVQQHGGVVNAHVDSGAEGLRGLFASGDLAAGDDILVIPETVIINGGRSTGSIITPILTYLREAHSPTSRFQPYLATMPDGSTILNACSIPLENVKLLHATFWEQHVLEWQQHLRDAWSGAIREELEYTFEDMLGDTNITFEQLQHACALVTTRYVHNSRGRLVLAPVFDMANHVRDCPHYLESGVRGALHLVAGSDLGQGEEVCYGYGSMRDDYAAFYYGFLPPEEEPPRLLVVDHPDFTGRDGDFKLTDEPFKGAPDQVHAELARLSTVLDGVESTQVPPAPEDDAPWATREGHRLMEGLRQRRVRALRYEVDRLTALLHGGCGSEHGQGNQLGTC